ncbi:MAG: competence/damage-inducible protein A [Deltaproteobacteria bacterium]|nr:competence/damage-inducible protein A [Deltaproteobacteria bacterium]
MPDPTHSAAPSATPVVINVGDEVLLGESANGNQQWMLATLQDHGLPAGLALCLPDDVEVIGGWIRRLRQLGHGPLFVSGGIGGTHDDHTREGIAVGLGLPLERDDRCHALLTAKYGDRYTPQRQRMALLPKGSQLIANPIGAPGFAIEDVYAFPGFPQMVQPMMVEVLGWPALAKGQPAGTVKDYRLPCAEGEISMDVEAFAAAHPHAKIGIYPSSEHFAKEVLLRIRCGPEHAATLDQFGQLVDRLQSQIAG